MASLQDMAGSYGLLSYPGSKMYPTGVQATPVPDRAPMAAAMPVAPAVEDRSQQLLSLLQKYQGSAESPYQAELAEARKAASTETAAFQKMLQSAVDGQTESAPSKAEMYFRLAAAFGTPGKTGNFFENLGAAGNVMAQQQKEEREAKKASAASRLQLGLEGQKMRMAGAKEDLSTLRTLAGEEMKDKRAIASKLLDDYVKSGQPQSSAGKQALDEGLKPGTPEYQKRVSQIAELGVEKQMMQIQAALSGISTQQANLGLAQANQGLAQQKFELQKEQATKLSAPEMKLKTETEDLVAQTESAYSNLKRALELNPKTFDASLIDTAQRKVLEAAGSKDPKVVNTREMENMLEKAALSQLKATFPGAISNDERQALLATQGLAAKSVEERGKIMSNAAQALKSVYSRNKKRLNEINQGAYRTTTMPGESE
jgi:hypothetical protein